MVLQLVSFDMQILRNSILPGQSPRHTAHTAKSHISDASNHFGATPLNDVKEITLGHSFFRHSTFCLANSVQFGKGFSKSFHVLLALAPRIRVRSGNRAMRPVPKRGLLLTSLCDSSVTVSGLAC